MANPSIGKTANYVCGKCGAEIPADARPGACPACLLETGLGLLTDEAVADGLSAVAFRAAMMAREQQIERTQTVQIAAKDAWRLWRLRIAGGNRPGWPGRSLPRATEKPQPHRRTQSDRLGPVGHGRAPEALPSAKPKQPPD